MRLAVSLHHHFRITPDGTVYPYSVFDYKFWCRYLEVFDDVTVFARLEWIDDVDPNDMPAKSSGPGVTFVPMPDFTGTAGYLKAYPKVRSLARNVLENKCACLLRVPSTIGTIMWKEIKRQGRPYGVEVVGDPWDAWSPGSIKSFIRPVIRRLSARNMKKQCSGADVVSYVTESGLQRRYPPGGWSTYYSSIELPAEAIVGEDRVQQRNEIIADKANSGCPWRLCYVGSLWHLAKAPDILIESVAVCIKNGVNLELTIVGDGQYRQELENQAKELGIADFVEFTGQLGPGQQVYEQLDRSDVYVLPSRQEGLPRSVIEAMARALPCITSNVAGLPELVQPEFLVKPNDISGLADTIAKMVMNIDAMKKAVKHNQKKASEYRNDVLQKRRVNLYSELKDRTAQWLSR